MPTNQTRQTGTVKWFNEGKGFGFIMPSNGGADLFAHISKVDGKVPLADGDEVTFETTKTPKGVQAEKIKIVSRLKAAA